MSSFPRQLATGAAVAAAVFSFGQPTPAQTPDTAPQGVTRTTANEPGGSSVRIVRLSLARGAVFMDRNAGRGYEPAFANIPVIAGAKLRTGQGVAEVEFEDNSSVRLGPMAEVTFVQLSRSATGATETAVQIEHGLVYVGLQKSKGNLFALTDGGAHLLLAPGTHLRLDGDAATTHLAVFNGEAVLQMGGVAQPVAKRQSVEIDSTLATVSAVSKGAMEGAFDAWDRQQNEFHAQKASLTATGGFGQYGLNDLSYYGSFSDLPGCGNVWRPYLASAAWDPFANGTWALYPGAGYSWVSPYPWGWLPFHSGSWASCGAAGWGWRPGGSWYGLNNAATLRTANQPVLQPAPRLPNGPVRTLVPVNIRPLNPSGRANEDGFVLRRDSAGLGVPRATVGSLRETSQEMERHGLAMQELHLSTMPGGASPGMVGAAGRLPQPGTPGLAGGAGARGGSAAAPTNAVRGGSPAMLGPRSGSWGGPAASSSSSLGGGAGSRGGSPGGAAPSAAGGGASAAGHR